MILAIDCGSTNFKAAIFRSNASSTAKLDRIADASLAVPYIVYDHEHVELDPEAIWNLFLELIRRACETAKVSTKEIRSISITSQAQTFTIVTPENRALLPLIGWADRRALSQKEFLMRKFGAEYHQHCSFSEAYPSLTASKILWVKENHPGYLAAENRVVSLPSFLTLRLAGVHATDSNLAAMGGAYSLKQGRWWREMLETIGVTTTQMGQLVEAGQPIAAKKLSSEIELSPDLKIVMACNDQTSGAMGNDVTQGGALITLGTALVAYRFAGNQPGPYEKRGCWGPFPGGGFYELATHSGGCSTLDWADKQMHGNVDSPRFVSLASKATARNDAGFFHPQQWGTERAWSGDIANDAERARSVLEGITFCARQLALEYLNIPSQRTTFGVIGGGSRLDAWLQMLADVLNANVRRGEGDTLLGAARIAVGYKNAIPSPSQDSSSQVHIFQPDKANVAFFEKRYQAWLASSK